METDQLAKELYRVSPGSIQILNPEMTSTYPIESYDLEKNIERVLSVRGVPRAYLQARLSSRSALDDGYFFHGSAGSGKTHRAVAIMREIIIQRSKPYRIDTIVLGIYDAWFYPVNDLLLRIRRTFEDGSAESEGDIIDRVSSHDLLVLDDMGAEKVSDWTLQTMLIIIDIRIRERKQTIITSNLSLDQMASVMDDRIASRIRGMCKVVEMSGPDRRARS